MLQLVHLLLATAAAYVFVRHAPLGRRERVLFVCGYFPCFEYAVVSRHYAAGALLLWLAAAGARSRRPALAVGAALALLCQTTVYGYILAVAFAAGWLLDRRRRRGELPPLAAGDAAAGLVLALAGAVAGLVQLAPAPGTSFAPSWRFHWDPALALRALGLPWRGMVPLPVPGLHFWNTNVLDRWRAVEAAAGVALLVLAAALLWRRRAALVAFGVGATGLVAFGYLKLMGQVRYDGHFWLLFAAALWLGGGLPREGAKAPCAMNPRSAFRRATSAPGSEGSGRRWRGGALLALLLVHLAAAVHASVMDLRHPFSNAAAAADRLRRQGLDRLPLLAHREPPASPVALALGRPLYFPSRGAFLTHPDWGPDRRDFSLPELRCAARGLARRAGQDVVLVLSHPIPPWPEVDPAGAALGAIVPSEDYHLYRLRRARLAATAAEAACAREAEGPR
jgi:hypothetical protein